MPDSGAPQFRYPQPLSWQRTDDPDLRILCQTSSDLHTWLPAAPADLNSPAPANPFLTTEDTGVVSRGLRQVRYRDLQSLAQRTRAFMHLMVVRRAAVVTTSAVDPFTFTPGQTAATSSTAQTGSKSSHGLHIARPFSTDSPNNSCAS